MPPFEAIIFDMDGLLVDTEPLWQQAEIAVFETVGIALTSDMCYETMGMRMDEVVRYWHDRFPWTGRSMAEVGDAVVDEVIRLVGERGKLMPGVAHALEWAGARHVPVALASSSPMRLIEAILAHFELKPVFQEIRSAETEPLGKPHPGVYLRTAQALGVAADRCIALEDSLNGLIAAKAARMRCIVVPEPRQYDDPRFAIADLKLKSLSELTAQSLR